MNVAITGATGFLGSHLTEQLKGSVEVTGVVRTPSKGEHLGIKLAKADLTDVDSLTEAFAGCDALVANAALSPGWKKPSAEAYMAANIQGATNQLEAAKRAGIRRIIWISTVAVYRTRLFGCPDEEAEKIDPDNPGFDWNNLTTDSGYTRSKAAGEKLAWAFAKEHDLEMTVFRPGPVYGPRDEKMTARYGRMLRMRVTVAPTVRLPHVHAADVAIAVRTALQTPKSIGRPYNLSGEVLSPASFLRTWRDASESTTRILPLPVPLRVSFDDSAARRDLKFSPRLLAEAVHELQLPER